MNTSLLGELDGIADQVAQNLLDPQGVGGDEMRNLVGHLVDHCDRASSCRLRHLHHIVDQLTNDDRAKPNSKLSDFHLSCNEQIISDRRENFQLPKHRPRKLTLLISEAGIQCEEFDQT